MDRVVFLHIARAKALLEAGVLPWYLRTLTFRRVPPDPSQAPNFNHSLSLNPPSAAVG
nr:hypothetical protein 1 - lamb's-quarters [Chenopodium album]